ncbi:hypothetical protein GCM10018771_70030 [Streptomyces cellulosae]|nr:hypothetical protein GCM10018771_70030 [Streptomyces cellulosae]
MRRAGKDPFFPVTTFGDGGAALVPRPTDMTRPPGGRTRDGLQVHPRTCEKRGRVWGGWVWR